MMTGRGNKGNLENNLLQRNIVHQEPHTKSLGIEPEASQREASS
jgi:hypothetical protein